MPQREDPKLEVNVDLADLARLLAVFSHPGNVGVGAVAAVGPLGAATVAVSTLSGALCAEPTGLLAVCPHPGPVASIAVAQAGPAVATGILAIDVLAF